MANNAIIFGDSYSTFAHYVPEAYPVFYSNNIRPVTDVTDVSQTWWHQVFTEANLNLILNDSWSGSTIGYTGYNNMDCSMDSSFICRFRKLAEQGFFTENKIDTVFVFGGTNDSWSNAPVGQMQYSDWEHKDLFCVLPAVCYFLKNLKDTLPEAKIYCLINTEIKPEIAEGIKSACEHFGITTISFDSIDKNSNHPTIKGMQDIKNGVLAVLRQHSPLA